MPRVLTLTIYVANDADPDRIIDGLNDIMLLMVEEGLIHDDLVACGSPNAIEGELGWVWRGPAARP